MRTRTFWFFLLFLLTWAGCARFSNGNRQAAAPEKAALRAEATEQSLLTLGQFPEPLIPVGGTPSQAENQALLEAIQGYHKSCRLNPEDLGHLEAFLTQFPKSPWVASLKLNCGLLYHGTGQYSKALASLRQAWQMLSTSKEPRAKAQADRTVGELAITWAYLGRYEELEPLLKEVRSRHLSGSATEMIAAAAEGLHNMQFKPGQSFLCGPMALERICLLRTKDHGPEVLKIVRQLRSTKKGTSLAQLWQAADQAGLRYQIAFRPAGAPVVTPAIVHWQVGHFSCLQEGQDKRFRVEDPTYGAFGDTITMAQPTLDSESSGYFLIPPGPLPKGWRAVSLAEGARVWGRGDTGENKDGRATTTCDIKDAKGCCGGMARWMSHTMVVGLALEDTPVGTSPSAFSLPFTINYAQREVSQPSVFTYTNFGPKWTCNWLSYITTDQYRSRANLYEMGGGLETFPFFLATGDGNTIIGPNSNTTLRRTIDANYVSTYVREFPDGSIATYDKVDTRTPYYAARVFLSKMTDPQGNTTTLQYDDQFRIQSITNATGKVMTLVYGLDQDPYKVTKVVDPYGRSAEFTYSANGLLASSTDTLGITSSFNYGVGDFINSLTTPYGTTNFQYGDASIDPSLGVTRWLTATDPSGRTSRVESRPLAAGIPTSETVFPQGQQINNIYLDYRNTFVWTPEQLAGGLDYTKATVYHFQHIYPLGGETGLGQFFGGTGRTVESMKKPLERRVWYTYKGNDRGATFEGSTSLPAVIGRVLGDGSTQLVRMDYNAQGNVISKIDPSGRSYAYQYASNGIDLTSMSVNGQQLMAASYDGSHNIQSLTNAAGGTSTFAYNARGQVTSATNELGEVTTYTYTADSNLGGIQAPLGANTSFGYDGIGRKISATDSEGYTVEAAYDSADRPTGLTFPDGTTEKLDYTLLDLTSTTDRLGRQATYRFDGSQRLTQVIDPNGGSTGLDYAESDQPVSLTDPGGRVTLFGYDLQSRLSVKQYSGGGTQVYTYLPCCGLPSTVTDALGHSKTYSYNVDNTLRNLAYSGSTPAVSFAYDTLLPRPVSMTDGQGQTSMTYGAFGSAGANQVKTVSGPFGDTASFDFDVAGRPISQTVNGQTESVAYDPLWRATQATNALDTFAMSYLGKTGQVTGVNSTLGPSMAYAYAPNAGDRRLTQIKNLGRSGSALSQFDYVHDAVGQITQLTETHGTATNTTGGGGTGGHCHKKCCHGNKCCKKHKCCKKKCCKGKGDCGDDDCDENHSGGSALVAPWDLSLLRGLLTLALATAWAALLWQFVRTPRGRTSRLAQVTSMALISCLTINGCIFGGGGTTSDTNVMDFSYDKLGQLIGVNVNQTATEGYTFDPSGNLTSLTVGNTTTTFSSNNLNQQTGPGTHVYDAKGQKTTLDGKTFEWDDEGRLTAIVQGTQRTELAYNGMSQRTKITELTNGAVTSKKLYWWLGGSIVCERDGLASGFPILKRYFGQGVLQGVTKLFYTTDHLGSIRELVDSAGVVQADYRYSTYGERTKESGNLDSDWGYAGLWHHAASGLDLATYRAYDAANRRWISRDPLGEGVDYNLYRYCGNNPISMVDPMGLMQDDIVMAGGKIRIKPGGAFDSSSEDQEAVRCSVNRIIKTKRGKDLLKHFSKEKPWIIRLNSTNPEGSRYVPTFTSVKDAGSKNFETLETNLNVNAHNTDPNYRTIRVDPTGQMSAPAPSLDRVLAHELGHAATGRGESTAIGAENAIMNDPAMGNLDPGMRLNLPGQQHY